MRRPSRSRALAAASALLAASAAPAEPPPPPPYTTPGPTIGIKLTLPPNALEHLGPSGLDPKDPAFAVKLKALASPASASLRGRVAPRTTQPAAVKLPAAAGLAAKVGAPVSATLQRAQTENGAPLGWGTAVKASPGAYYLLFETPQKVSVPPGPAFGGASMTFDWGCSASVPYYAVVASADDPNLWPGLSKVAPANGKWSYWVKFGVGTLPIGRKRTAPTHVSFGSANAASFPLDYQADVATYFVTALVTHAPELVAPGAGFDANHAKLANPGAARVGAGNWQVQTQGDDLLGVGVALAPGAKVTATAIKSALSAVSPQDLTPDNSWRGATVTAPPAGSDLRTGVRWHFSGIDTLDYVLEWTIEAPLGQRPLLTMPKPGDCSS